MFISIINFSRIFTVTHTYKYPPFCHWNKQHQIHSVLFIYTYINGRSLICVSISIVFKRCSFILVVLMPLFWWLSVTPWINSKTLAPIKNWKCYSTRLLLLPVSNIYIIKIQSNKKNRHAVNCSAYQGWVTMYMCMYVHLVKLYSHLSDCKCITVSPCICMGVGTNVELSISDVFCIRMWNDGGC